MEGRMKLFQHDDCPRCGSSDVAGYAGATIDLIPGATSKTVHKVACRTCEAQTKSYSSRTEADSAWTNEEIIGGQDGEE